MADDDLVGRVARYYEGRLAEHGATPRGVDWSSAASQDARFGALLRICEDAPEVRILDFGCGYGALVDVLLADGRPFHYVGYDAAPAMIAAAQARYRNEPRVEFTADAAALRPVDYVVASGVFNVMTGPDRDVWHAYCERTVDRLAALSLRGYAYNMLTTWSDPERMRSDLFYGDPAEWFARAMSDGNRQAAVLHDYGLFEFTVLSRVA